MKISELLDRLDAARERRCLAEELLNNASEVFGSFWSLEKFTEYEKNWEIIEHERLYDSRFYYENRKESGEIKNFFTRVQNAYISRRELEELLKPFEKAVEIYIENKKKEEADLKNALTSLYDEFFVANFAEYSFIFGSDVIKQGVIEFLQSSKQVSLNQSLK